MRPWPWEQPASPAPTADQLLRRLRAKRSRAEGRRGEQLVEHRLKALGVTLVEKVNVERRQIGKKALFVKAVSGDFRGLLHPYGRSVLVEVKTEAETLSLSDFEKHQLDALELHQQAGGVSLVAWVRGVEVYIMPYANFRANCSKGQPLTAEIARPLTLTRPLARPI